MPDYFDDKSRGGNSGGSGGGLGINPDNTGGSSGVGQNYGTSDWEPDSNYLTTLTADEIATGYGLDASEYASYFQSFDGWKGDFAEKQFTLDSASLTAKKDYDLAELQSQTEVLGLESQEAGGKLGDALSQNINASSDAYADTMSQVINSQASGLMGGASSRGARTIGARQQESTNVSSTGATTNYGATTNRINQALSDITRKSDFMTDQFTRDKQSLALDRDSQIRNEVEQFKDDIYGTLDVLGREGVFDDEGLTTDDYLSRITSGTKWENSDFKGYDDDFLKWFMENEGSVDRDMFADSRSEVEAAYGDFQRGEEAGTSTVKGTTWCCTAAEKNGHMSRFKTARLGVWHRQQSSIWQDGYNVWGKFIANNLVSKYKWAGEWTEAFYQYKVRNKRSIQGLGAILFIAPMSYVIGTFISFLKRISNYE